MQIEKLKPPTSYTAPNKSLPLKKKGKSLFQQLFGWYCILQKHLQIFWKGYATCILIVPENRCPSCDIALVQCIEMLHQKGYSPIIEFVPVEKDGCHEQLQALVQLVEKVRPRIPL